ncbi:hypothetical protein E2320_012104 [Naja naja]|nr:hypothetical protein E2320_012104 [Naja naja]
MLNTMAWKPHPPLSPPPSYPSRVKRVEAHRLNTQGRLSAPEELQKKGNLGNATDRRVIWNSVPPDPVNNAGEKNNNNNDDDDNKPSLSTPGKKK